MYFIKSSLTAMILFFSLFQTRWALASQCDLFLNPVMEPPISIIKIPFEDWSIHDDYIQLKDSLEILKAEGSIRKIVTLYRHFEASYHDRYNRYMENLIDISPALEHDFLTLKKSLAPFYKIEEKARLAFKDTLFDFKGHTRIHFLRSLSPEKLLEIEDLLDVLMGVDLGALNKMISEEVSAYEGHDSKKKSLPGEIHQEMATTDTQNANWKDLIQWIETTDLQTDELVVHRGSGVGRLGFLLGVMKPEIRFIGIESMHSQVQYANDVVRKNGFKNISFIQGHLTESSFPLPPADHIYQ